jgi:MFS transporter, PAT family, beta-lactamase induction signal transducer AmpG
MKHNEQLSASATKPVHPSIFMFLYLPFGVFPGYISVTLGFLLTQAGVPLAGVASIVSIPYLPNILKFLWAPLVDTTLTVKKWYNIANIGTAIGILATCILPLNTSSLTPLLVIVFLASVANTVIAMSTESLIAQDVPNELKGRAGGWLQAGNLGGFGVGGGAGIWLAQKISDPWISGAIIAGICLLCGLGLILLNEPEPFTKEENYLRTIGSLGKDIWTLIKARAGFLVLILCILPIGSGGASNLWSSISKDWNASPDAVALAVGVVGGVSSAIGCLVGGWICDLIDRKKAYILFGLLEGACALLMAISPRTELMFVIWTSVYAVTIGLAYAGFSAFVLEAIGKIGAATKYNVFAAFSNVPIYVMIFVDEWAHGKWSATGMLLAETIMPIIGAIVFISVWISVNKITNTTVSDI